MAFGDRRAERSGCHSGVPGQWDRHHRGADWGRGSGPSTQYCRIQNGGGAHGVQHPRLESASQMAVAAVSVFRDQVCPCVSSFNMPWEHSGSYKDTDAQVEVSCTADSRRG